MQPPYEKRVMTKKIFGGINQSPMTKPCPANTNSPLDKAL